MELLVRVVDHLDQPDLELRGKRLGVGDVITIKPDNWPWSVIERTKSEWRIIRVPILQTTAEALLKAVHDVSGNLVKRREWSVDLSLLPGPSQFQGARSDEIITLTRAEVSGAVRQKATVEPKVDGNH